MRNIKRFIGVVAVGALAVAGLRCSGDTIINITDPQGEGSEETQPPTGPTDLRLTVLSPSGIRLSWTDNASNETGFTVMRGTGSDAVNTLAATLAQESKSFEDTGLQPSTTYYYHVFAYNAAGNSSSHAVGSATTGAAPAIAFSPGDVAFTATVGGSSPSVQAVSVTNSGGGTLAGLSASVRYGAGQATGWLTATLNQTTAPATLTLQATTTSIAEGSYLATVSLSATNAGNNPQSLPVTLTMTSTAGAPQIALSAATADFFAATGGAAPPSQMLGLSNGGSGSLTGLASAVTYGSGEPTGWLSAVLSGTTAPANLTLQAMPAALPAGLYHATVAVTSAVATNSPQTLDVTLTVTAGPLIGLAPANVTFAAQQGGGDPVEQSVTVTNEGGGSLTGLDLTITYGGGQPTGWLSASFDVATAPATLTLQAVTGALAAGSYTASVSVTSAAADNSPQNVSVTFDVAAATGPTVLRIVNDLSSEILQGFDWGQLNTIVTLQVHSSIDSIYAGNGVHQLLYGWDQTADSANTLAVEPGSFEDFDVSGFGLGLEYFVLIWAGHWEYDGASGYWNKTYSSVLDCDGLAGAANKWSIIRIVPPFGQPEVINLSWVLPQTHWQNSGLCP